ncbi:hypothetical protein H6F77_18545 [Microcoleus sp. FACHB-831]|uniref:hypothetical protein n=1 Tax=Microcoleus sp. FACHB-831 TaxID=2692827 RepID=UPI001686072A|nr:hypothetical protein [Microcoleus sp. FACHB-831]MBD1923054.1 hypothetical protein [Microcoleus sp. FACHB-831]
MNTPSHVILNLAILINPQSISQPLPILCGAVLPDIPMFLLYFWAKFIRRLPERQIWTETYYEPFWQNITHTFHSIPLALIGWLVAYYFSWQEIQIIFSSVFLHSLCDLPVHNDDAHRHFLPFSNYRFISPISYWDVKHHGEVVAKVEMLLVLVATLYVLPFFHSYISKGLLIGVNLMYLLRLLRYAVAVQRADENKKYS